MTKPNRFTVLTIFPEALAAPLSSSLLGKARERGIIAIDVVDIRAFADPPHRSTDDAPYGGGAGMVMTPGPIVAAIEATRTPGCRVALFSPAGRAFSQSYARELAESAHTILVCGRYEGVDERVAAHFVDEEISIGDYVLGGGEAAAWVVIEATARLVPGMVGNSESVERESFEDALLDFPHYTRPRDFRGHPVPEELLSGDHAAIAVWRRAEQRQRTQSRRPDLYKRWLDKGRSQ